MSSSFLESQRLAQVQAPVIPIIGELAAKTPGTISLGQGVVFYPPPQSALDQVEAFKKDPLNHKYKLVSGIPPLIDALWKKLALENQIQPTNRYLIVTAGANLAFTNALFSITNPEDEVILLSPYYFNHEMAVRIAGCLPVICPTTADFQPNLSEIKKLITSRTRAIVTISPNNPTGAVYSHDALLAINRLCRDHGVFHISDEAYEYFLYDGAQHYSPASFPDSEPHTISLFSLSKAYGFASWRIGYMVIPEQLSVAIKKLQDTFLICAPVVSQFAALGALGAAKQYCAKHLQEIASVRGIFYERLAELEGLVSAPQTNGAFYSLLQLPKGFDSMEIAQQLVLQHRVAVIPGTAFGVATPALRVSFGALDRSSATEAISRLIRGLKLLLK